MRLGLFTKISLGHALLLVFFMAMGGYSLYVYHSTAAEFKAVNRFHLKLTLYSYELESRQSMLLLVLGSAMSEERTDMLLRRWLSITVARRNAGLKRIEKLCASIPQRWRDSYFEVRILPVVERIRSMVNELEYPSPSQRMAPSEFERLAAHEKRVMTLVHKLALASRSRLRRVAARLEDEEQLQVRVILALLVMLLALSIAALLVAHRSLAPLQDIIEGARAFGQGRMDARIEVRSRDELGELAQEFNDMAQAIVEREERLVKTERLAAAGKLAAGIAHEIRNPLAAISFQVELMQELLESGEPEDLAQAREILSRLQGELDRLQQSTTQYLEFARQPVPRMEPHDLRDLTAELGLATEGLGISLVVDVPDGCGVMVDGDMFHRIMLNLLKNSVEAGAREARLSARCEGARVVLFYTDDGDGIPEDVGDRIFEPFYSTKKKGTGLGLALVRRMMMDMGGSITLVDLKPPTFRLEFRRSDGDEAA